MSGAPSFTATDAIDLLQWKHAIFGLYSGGPRSGGARASLARVARDPRSDVPRSSSVADPGRRAGGFRVLPVSTTTTRRGGRSPQSRASIADPTEIAASTGGTFSFTRIGIARFALGEQEHELDLAWNDGYGGGIFLAFTDETERHVDLRRRPLPDRHGQGRRSRFARRLPSCSTSTRLQPVVRLRRPLGLPARARREPVGGRW